MFRNWPLLGRLYDPVVVENKPAGTEAQTTNAAVDAVLAQTVATPAHEEIAPAATNSTHAVAAAAHQPEHKSSLAGLTLAEPLPEPTNPLEPFYNRLTAAEKELDTQEGGWDAHIANYMRYEQPHPGTDHASECKIEALAAKTKSNAGLFFDMIKAIFESARDNMQAQIDEALIMHLNPLREHIASLIKEGNDPAKSESERRDLAIHAGRANILLIAELRALLGKIQHDLEERTKREARIESTVLLILNIAIYTIGKIVGLPIPSLNSDCTERFQHLIDNASKGQQVEVRELVAEVEGLSAQTVAAFQDLETMPANSGHSVFSSRPVLNDAQAPAAEEEARHALRNSAGGQ